MKKILFCTTFVLVISSVFAQRTTFDNYYWSRTNRYNNQWSNANRYNNQWSNANRYNNQWGNNGWNDGWNNNQWNNNQWNNGWNGGGGVSVANNAIGALERIITVGIVAKAAGSSGAERSRSTKSTHVCPQTMIPYSYYIDRQDEYGNWFRDYYQ